jgi:hypothetical protein
MVRDARRVCEKRAYPICEYGIWGPARCECDFRVVEDVLWLTYDRMITRDVERICKLLNELAETFIDGRDACGSARYINDNTSWFDMYEANWRGALFWVIPQPIVEDDAWRHCGRDVTKCWDRGAWLSDLEAKCLLS